jgi:hypothetical protein
MEVEPRCGRPSTQAKSRTQPRELRRTPTLPRLPCRIREFSRPTKPVKDHTSLFLSSSEHAPCLSPARDV